MKINSFQAITSTIQTCTKQLRKTRPHPHLSGNNGSWVFLGFLSVRTESSGCVALFFKFLENALRSPTQFCGKCTKCHLDHQNDWEVPAVCFGAALGVLVRFPSRFNTLARAWTNMALLEMCQAPEKSQLC